MVLHKINIYIYIIWREFIFIKIILLISLLSLLLIPLLGIFIILIYTSYVLSFILNIHIKYFCLITTIFFLVLDILLFYIFFESILPSLFLLIGLFGSSNKVRASFYLFLYTLLGSLFMLLSIITMSSIMGTTDFDALSKANYSYIIQLFLFYGIFLSFAVKTPTIFLNT